MDHKKRVFVGLSGGVDSSVSALLLKQAGYDVTGVYMKNWSKSLPGFECPWEEDYRDAKRVALQLGIEFLMCDFEQDYFDKVVQYMIDGFKAGITPNPDILCNQEIKFKLFYQFAKDNGADLIATGHYAQTQNSQLLKAVDENKDQTYFLYRVNGEVLKDVLFPIGHLTKPKVRNIAEENNLVTARKKESMGICFVGKVGIKEFLSHYVSTVPGAVIDQNGRYIGEHDGALFYTIGQRHGLHIGGGLPYYVTGKDMGKNEVYVTNNLNDQKLWFNEAHLTSVHWVSMSQEIRDKSYDGLQVRTRHRARLIDCQIAPLPNGDFKLSFNEPIRALTPGQSAVLYDGNVCLGGGIVA